MARKDLTTEERNYMVQFLLSNQSGGKLIQGAINEAAEKWTVSRRTVSRFWAAAKEKKERGEIVIVKSRKFDVKRTRINIDYEKMQSLKAEERGTIRGLAAALELKKTTVGRRYQQGKLKAHTSSLKPDLTANNKLMRMQFTLQAIEFDRIHRVLKFKTMYDTIHIDEKWFYITKPKNRFYMTPTEVAPHRTIKNKGFIPKIMFMCAVSRPLFADDGSVLFDGKIVMYPFTQNVPAKRGSKRRPAGTIETKPIDSIDKNVIKRCLIDQIVPAIKAKWPIHASKTIYIQQDNARPHLKDDDSDFRAVASSDGFDIHLIQQPPNSPDLNINDLGWFRALQSLQHKTSSYTVDVLVSAVMNSFTELSPTTLNNVFLSLQCCMVEILKVRGHNKYDIPHMKKQQLIRQGLLPVTLEVDGDLVRDCINYLKNEGQIEGIQGLMNDLGI